MVVESGVKGKRAKGNGVGFDFIVMPESGALGDT